MRVKWTKIQNKNAASIDLNFEREIPKTERQKINREFEMSVERRECACSRYKYVTSGEYLLLYFFVGLWIGRLFNCCVFILCRSFLIWYLFSVYEFMCVSVLCIGLKHIVEPFFFFAIYFYIVWPWLCRCRCFILWLQISYTYKWREIHEMFIAVPVVYVTISINIVKYSCS